MVSGYPISTSFAGCWWINGTPEFWGVTVYGATFKVCCLRGDREGLSYSEVFVWFETKSPRVVW